MITKNPNEYIIYRKEAWIYLCDKQGNRVDYTIIDSEDLERVLQYRWYLSVQGYAVTRLSSRQMLWMHNLIMRITSHDPQNEVDHINQDKLVNQKSNLRLCTRSRNALNTGPYSHNTSGYKGVSYHKQRKKWRAHIRINNKQIHLGLFDDIEDAIIARTIAEARL